MNIRIFLLGWKIKFLDEKRTKPYIRYGDGNIADKNLICRQKYRGTTGSAGWQAGTA